METNTARIAWLEEIAEHVYAAADSFLRLIDPDEISKELVERLRAAPITRFKAKDVFRASQLSLLGISNTHVEKDRKKIRNGTGLSPILLVRDGTHGRVIVADGYHRLCAIYEFDEDAWVMCKIL